MDMSMGDVPSGPLSAAGVDFSNSTQAANFLAELLDDTELQVEGNTYAKYFWYGVVVVVGLVAVYNVARWLDLRAR
jgi:ferric-chelate reductase